ncbi:MULTISPECIES: GvpL/GvpF family gas vesicle protein [unclassified Streptomyces]|uniref:GvpL/GvpF family gas vesicle protein n=1 Tax=unclassified Streptomyces TaxID=2593676 RepID=UPI0009A0D5D4|nr:GvpL/GvpF family gas vesicle protein [Streptomyces sp. TSRI0107]
MNADATLVCAFAVLSARPAGAEPHAHPGHDGGGPLRVLPAGDLFLLVQDVPAAGFGEAALAQRLERPDELERVARAHHRAVETAARWGPAVPLPLATLYLTDDTAVRAVVEREAELAALLDRLRGRTEWAVKVHAATAATTSPPSDAGIRHNGDAGIRNNGTENDGTGTDRGVAGRAYLRRVSARRRTRQEEHEQALAEARAVDRELRRHAVAATRHRPQSSELTGKDAPQLLNGAYLVDDADRAAFTGALERLTAAGRLRGVEVVASGPWVPYSFARLDEQRQCAERDPEQQREVGA